MFLRVLPLLLCVWCVSPAAGTLVPGDDRAGYDSQEYVSGSRRLDVSPGPALDLAALARNPPLGLPRFPHPVPPAAAIELGRALFHDRRLSANGTLSCAMCHVPEQGFTQNELRTPVGFEGRSVRRNAPSLYNVAWRPALFHDGRESSLEEQAWFPLLAANEMGNRDERQVLEAVAGIPAYAAAFRAVFGAEVSRATLGSALASYQRVLASADTAFDRWYFAGEEQALAANAVRGFGIFRDAGCADCHSVGEGAALFSDGLYHDTGIAYRASVADRRIRRLQLAPGLEIEVQVDEPAPYVPDLGRMEASGEPGDRWRIRTPTLRNVALTAPYMHDGSLADLDAVIAYYDAGGTPHAGQDPRIRPLGLGVQERAALRAFLEALTGSNVEALAADARSVRIGDQGLAPQSPPSPEQRR